MDKNDLAMCPDPAEGLADDCLIEGEIRVVAYLDGDGEEMYGFAVTDGFPVSKTLGLLEIVKNIVAHQLLHAYMDEERGDE